MKNRKAKGPGRSRDFAFHYREGDSPIHRMGAGWKLVLVCALGTGAAAVRSVWAIVILVILNLFYYFAAGLKWKDLLADTKYFLFQTVVVVGLYVIKFGLPGGLWPGFRTGLQILLFFLPGIVMLRSTTGSQMMRSLKRILPPYLSFLVFTSLRFVPFFTREFREIAAAQRLRGARIAPRQLMNPFNWKDVVHCVMIPLVIRAVKTAGEAALSAEARSFGRNQERGKASR